MHELRSVTRLRGGQTIALYCSQHHRASALYPVINLYERGAGMRPDDGPTERLAKLEALLSTNRADLERTVPIVATLLSIPLGDRYPPLRLTPEELKEQTLQLLIRRVQDLSLRNPVLCLLEDAHWIDPTSSELLSKDDRRLEVIPRPCDRDDTNASGQSLVAGASGASAAVPA